MNRNKNRLKIVGLTAVAVLIAGAIALLCFYFSGRENPGQGAKEKESDPVTTDAALTTGEQDTDQETGIDMSQLENMTLQIETDENFVEPGKNTLNLNQLNGFTQKKNNKKGNSNGEDAEAQETGLSSELEQVKVRLSDSNLTVESVGSYMGSYLEDGSDAPVRNVAAIVVTNHSDRMLQVGDIRFQVRENETAEFRITNLLPDTSVLVLERNQREYNAEDDYSYGEVINAYLETPSLMEDEFSIEKENGKLWLKNKTDQEYKKVYVYYKYVQSGGAYMGGITYRVPFENIKAKGTVESIANHFSVNTSRIVDVRVAEQ